MFSSCLLLSFVLIRVPTFSIFPPWNKCGTNGHKRINFEWVFFSNWLNEPRKWIFVKLNKEKKKTNRLTKIQSGVTPFASINYILFVFYLCSSFRVRSKSKSKDSTLISVWYGFTFFNWWRITVTKAGIAPITYIIPHETSKELFFMYYILFSFQYLWHTHVLCGDSMCPISVNSLTAFDL